MVSLERFYGKENVEKDFEGIESNSDGVEDNFYDQQDYEMHPDNDKWEDLWAKLLPDDDELVIDDLDDNLDYYGKKHKHK